MPGHTDGTPDTAQLFHMCAVNAGSHLGRLCPWDTGQCLQELPVGTGQ